MIRNKVYGILERASEPLDSSDIARMTEFTNSEVSDVLEEMYWSSKIEKRMEPRRLSVYRIPGKNDGKLSLPN